MEHEDITLLDFLHFVHRMMDGAIEHVLYGLLTRMEHRHDVAVVFLCADEASKALISEDFISRLRLCLTLGP